MHVLWLGQRCSRKTSLFPQARRPLQCPAPRYTVSGPPGHVAILYTTPTPQRLLAGARSRGHGGTERSSTVSQTSSTDVWRSQREGGVDRSPSAPLEHGDRPRVGASAFPGSHRPEGGKRGGWSNLRPSLLSEGGEAVKEAGRRVWKLRTAMVAAIAVREVEVAGRPGCRPSPPTQLHRRKRRCREDCRPEGP